MSVKKQKFDKKILYHYKLNTMSTIRKALKLLPKFKNKSILFVFLLLIATSLETLGIGLIFL